jgi:phosphate:Na+ symporter
MVFTTLPQSCYNVRDTIFHLQRREELHMGISDVLTLLGGLAFFLFGMSLLGDGLKRVAGSKLETILGRLTSTTLKGILLGTLVTAVIQSSSATTVMVVGFVNSGIMQLTNAVGIIMGANVGTTATGWVLTLAGVDGGGSSGAIFAFIAFIGIVLYFFCKKTSQKNVGMILLAFAVLMSGMQSMSSAMAPLKTSQAFLDIISAASNPAVSLLVGTLVTAVIQSSSASIGILQALSVTGVISYEVAIPMVLGMCIGACVPVLLSAIGANVNGKRAAIIYLYFNIVGTIILMIPFYLYHGLVGFDFMALPASSVGIAIANTVYKVLATIILAPFASWLERLSVLTIKDNSTEEDEKFEENLLDERFLNYPPLAVEQSGKTMEKMSTAAFKNLSRSIDLLHKFNLEKYEKIMSRENVVDRYEDRLGAYLVRLNTHQLSPRETQDTAKYLHCLTNVERISDHAVNLAQLAEEMSRKGIAFSEQANAELNVCIDAVREIISLTQVALVNNDLATARHVEPLEEVIDMLTEELKVRHINRLQAGDCTLELGFIFNDCINNFERVADHCSNIAVAVLEAADSELQSHDYLRGIKQDKHDEYRGWLELYEMKYCQDLRKLQSKEETAAAQA